MISFRKNISSIFFQYSDRTIASRETNNNSTKSSDTQLSGAGKSELLALSGGLHHDLPKKDIEKKGKFNGAKSGCKKKNLIAPSLFLYYELSVCPLILNSNKVYFGSSLIAKPSVYLLAAIKIDQNISS